ncbi:hypothetical protein SCUCBS95973_007974 [Sporothrix curviconia]|uniref:Uncharacterized protein n=1 Tax=Sporothrix curviconia TaxID=1260050 RepID=A0ABP0CI38_9PEZI
MPHLSPRNTRLQRKTTAEGAAVEDENHVPIFEVLVASIDRDPATAVKRVHNGILRAIPLAGTETRKSYQTKLLAFIQSGDVEMHKLAAIDWLSDARLVVETWAGFLEPGRDPSGVRCEFRTLVAVKDRSWERIFSGLAAGAEQLILQLPWNAGRKSPFELDTFVLPDLSALNPKYGYKNLTFTNRAKANSAVADQDYIVDKDVASYEKHFDMSFFFQLALHEMLGHGCGELCRETAPGQFNFDPADMPVNPLTNEPVNSWYSLSHPPEAAFVGIATGYVECLAEGIGLYIMSSEGAQKILAPHTELDMDEVIYNAYLSIARVGLRALRSYDSRSQVPSGTAKVEVHLDNSGVGSQPRRSLKVTLDRSKIKTVGHQALGDLIFKLQICRSIKDVARGTAIFMDLTTVSDKELLWKE